RTDVRPAGAGVPHLAPGLAGGLSDGHTSAGVVPPTAGPLPGSPARPAPVARAEVGRRAGPALGPAPPPADPGGGGGPGGAVETGPVLDGLGVPASIQRGDGNGQRPDGAGHSTE